MVDVPHGCDRWKTRIAHPDRRIHVWHEVVAREFERLFAQGVPQPRFRLLSVREIRSLNSWMHNVNRLVRSQKPALRIHPLDAAELGVSDGDPVYISTAADRLQVPVKLSDEVVRGAVCYPHGWGHKGGSWQTANATEGVNINRLLGLGTDAIEFISGSSLIDGLEVFLEKVERGERDRQAGARTAEADVAA